VRKREDSAEYVLALRALEDGQKFNKYSLATHLGIHPRNAREYIDLLLANNIVYVDIWQQSKNRGPWFPVVAMGSRRSAPKPGKDEKLARLRARRRPAILAQLIGGESKQPQKQRLTLSSLVLQLRMGD